MKIKTVPMSNGPSGQWPLELGGGPTVGLPKGSEAILFVDDEILLVQLGTNFLNRLGYRATACTSATKALDLHKSDPNSYDLLIADLFMPDMSGLDLVAACKTIRPDFPTIICSGQSFLDPGFQKKSRALDIGAVLSKPFGLKNLACTVRTVLDKHREKLQLDNPHTIQPQTSF